MPACRAVPGPQRPLALLFVVQALLSTRHINAQRPDFETPDWAKHSLYWVSSDSPMLKHMLSQPGFNTSSDIILTHMADVEQSVNKALRNQTDENRQQFNFRPCTIEHKKFEVSVEQAFGMRGLPDPEEDCVTDVTGTQLRKDDVPRFSTDDIFDAFAGLKQMLDREKHYFIMEILLKWSSARILVDWNRPSSGLFLPFKRANKNCTVAGVGMKRVNSSWYYEISVTNVPSTDAPKHWHRQSIYEFVHVGPDGRDARALIQRLPQFVTDDVDGPPVANTTTGFSRGKGLAMPGAYYPVFQEENPALLAAVAEADVPIRQATDALTASMLSILFLPLVLNLVPIALITHVSTRVMLLYMLASDVVSVVPLLIKGGELIMIGSQRYRAVTVRLENLSSGQEGVAAAGQLWTAECRANIDALEHGIWFVSIACAAVVFGIVFELWARRFVKRRHRLRLEKQMLFRRIADDETYETYDAHRGRGVPKSKLGFLPDDWSAHQA